jgi:hypothetical protein
MAFPDQALENGIVAEIVVDLEIIRGVILVVGGRLENRVEIEGVHSQTLKVIEMIDDALKVPSEEITGLRLSSPLFDAGRVVGRVTVGEPLRENLIPDRVLRPVRDDRLG